MGAQNPCPRPCPSPCPAVSGSAIARNLLDGRDILPFEMVMSRLVLLALVAAGCQSNPCEFNSECPGGYYCSRGVCQRDCAIDIDCASWQRCDPLGRCMPAYDGAVAPDAGDVMRDDAGPRVDGGAFDAADITRDSGGGMRDAGLDAGMSMPGVGRYLDRCTGDGDCMSGRCVDDVGGTRMCSITCTRHAECAAEHVCATGVCRPDDTGVTCRTATAATCTLGLCVGNATTGSGHCTRECANASECPSGYACADAGGTRVCVDIEQPCSSGTSCATGLCLTVQGCTAECRNAADCPARLPFLPPYRCEIAFGSARPICVPPEDVLGPDPIGAICPATGTNDCRSGACDPSAPGAPMCTQSCNEEGGCAVGLGCFPQVDVDTILLLCSRAGSRSLTAACMRGSECASGLCDATDEFCTRLCTSDALCPTGYRCEAVPGFALSICRR